MDYKEEQAGEIQALKSIYEGDLEVIEESPYHTVTMPVRAHKYDSDSDSPSGLYVRLRITHTSKYPDQIPELEIEEIKRQHERRGPRRIQSPSSFGDRGEHGHGDDLHHHFHLDRKVVQQVGRN